MKLVDVPNLEFMESPSSWLTRIALRQVVSPYELASYLGLSVRVDCEMSVARSSLVEISERFAKADGSSNLIDLVLTRLREIDTYGGRFLLRHKDIAYHRFCAGCLATDRVKYFRLEWRFKSWRWCPSHNCLLHECCPHCGNFVKLPKDMFTAGPDRQGVATLDRCLNCGELLTTGWAESSDTLNDQYTTLRERVLLGNGRATLAALAKGTLRIDGREMTFGYRQLKLIERLGYLPHVNFRLTQDTLRRRHMVDSMLL